MSRARAEINLAAIAENLKLIKSKTSAQVLAVVKADAYGHGLINVAKEAEKAGADWLGTALVEEGIALRNGGITKPIISWLTPLGEDFKTAINLDIDLSISSIELLNEIISVGKSINKVPRVHIEIDTGMNRGGFGGVDPARDPIADIAAGKTPETKNEAKADTLFFVQTGVFSQRAEADAQKANLAMQGIQAQLSESAVDGNSVWRVRIGPFGSIEDTTSVRSKLTILGIKPTVIRVNRS